MVKTRKVKQKKKFDLIGRWHHPNWDLGAVIVALLGTFLLLVSLLSKPSFDIIGQHVVLTQGIVAPAVILASVAWAIAEFFTPPSTGIKDLLIRIIPAFIVGGLVGGILGYMYHFGDYVLRPAMSGNLSALLFLVSILAASLAILWNAAWGDKHGFRGQKGKGIHVLNAKESGTSKAKRGMLFLLIVVVVMLVAAPIGAGVGSLFVSGHDNTAVLTSQAEVTSVSASTGAVAFGTVNGTSTFDMPVNITTVYVQTNLTLAELNDYSVSHLMIVSSVSNYNLTIGSGTMKNFNPLFTIDVKNSTHANVALPVYRLTGIQSQPLVLKITTTAPEIAISIHPYGNNGFITTMGPYAMLQGTYIIAAIIMFMSAFMELSMYDVDLSFMGIPARNARRNTRRNR